MDPRGPPLRPPGKLAPLRNAPKPIKLDMASLASIPPIKGLQGPAMKEALSKEMKKISKKAPQQVPQGKAAPSIQQAPFQDRMHGLIPELRPDPVKMRPSVPVEMRSPYPEEKHLAAYSYDDNARVPRTSPHVPPQVFGRLGAEQIHSNVPKHLITECRPQRRPVPMVMRTAKTKTDPPKLEASLNVNAKSAPRNLKNMTGLNTYAQFSRRQPQKSPVPDMSNRDLKKSPTSPVHKPKIGRIRPELSKKLEKYGIGTPKQDHQAKGQEKKKDPNNEEIPTASLTSDENSKSDEPTIQASLLQVSDFTDENSKSDEPTKEASLLQVSDFSDENSKSEVPTKEASLLQVSDFSDEEVKIVVPLNDETVLGIVRKEIDEVKSTMSSLREERDDIAGQCVRLQKGRAKDAMMKIKCDQTIKELVVANKALEQQMTDMTKYLQQMDAERELIISNQSDDQLTVTNLKLANAELESKVQYLLRDIDKLEDCVNRVEADNQQLLEHTKGTSVGIREAQLQAQLANLIKQQDVMQVNAAADMEQIKNTMSVKLAMADAANKQHEDEIRELKGLLQTAEKVAVQKDKSLQEAEAKGTELEKKLNLETKMGDELRDGVEKEREKRVEAESYLAEMKMAKEVTEAELTMAKSAAVRQENASKNDSMKLAQVEADFKMVKVKNEKLESDLKEAQKLVVDAQSAAVGLENASKIKSMKLSQVEAEFKLVKVSNEKLESDLKEAHLKIAGQNAPPQTCKVGLRDGMEKEREKREAESYLAEMKMAKEVTEAELTMAKSAAVRLENASKNDSMKLAQVEADFKMVKVKNEKLESDLKEAQKLVVDAKSASVGLENASKIKSMKLAQVEAEFKMVKVKNEKLESDLKEAHLKITGQNAPPQTCKVGLRDGMEKKLEKKEAESYIFQNDSMKLAQVEAEFKMVKVKNEKLESDLKEAHLKITGQNAPPQTCKVGLRDGMEKEREKREAESYLAEMKMAKEDTEAALTMAKSAAVRQENASKNDSMKLAQVEADFKMVKVKNEKLESDLKEAQKLVVDATSAAVGFENASKIKSMKLAQVEAEFKMVKDSNEKLESDLKALRKDAKTGWNCIEKSSINAEKFSEGDAELKELRAAKAMLVKNGLSMQPETPQKGASPVGFEIELNKFIEAFESKLECVLANSQSVPVDMPFARKEPLLAVAFRCIETLANALGSIDRNSKDVKKYSGVEAQLTKLMAAAKEKQDVQNTKAKNEMLEAELRKIQDALISEQNSKKSHIDELEKLRSAKDRLETDLKLANKELLHQQRRFDDHCTLVKKEAEDTVRQRRKTLQEDIQSFAHEKAAIKSEMEQIYYMIGKRPDVSAPQQGSPHTADMKLNLEGITNISLRRKVQAFIHTLDEFESNVAFQAKQQGTTPLEKTVWAQQKELKEKEDMINSLKTLLANMKRAEIEKERLVMTEKQQLENAMSVKQHDVVKQLKRENAKHKSTAEKHLQMLNKLYRAVTSDDDKIGDYTDGMLNKACLLMDSQRKEWNVLKQRRREMTKTQNILRDKVASNKSEMEQMMKQLEEAAKRDKEQTDKVMAVEKTAALWEKRAHRFKAKAQEFEDALKSTPSCELVKPNLSPIDQFSQVKCKPGESSSAFLELKHQYQIILNEMKLKFEQRMRNAAQKRDSIDSPKLTRLKAQVCELQQKIDGHDAEIQKLTQRYKMKMKQVAMDSHEGNADTYKEICSLRKQLKDKMNQLAILESIQKNQTPGVSYAADLSMSDIVAGTTTMDIQDDLTSELNAATSYASTTDDIKNLGDFDDEEI